MYYHGFDRDSLYLVPYMKRYFLETRLGQRIFNAIMILSMVLSNFLVWEKEFIFLKILGIILFNVLCVGFIGLSWICFKMFSKDENE